MLPLNFHKTFIPERRLIGAILEYAARGKDGNYQQIADETGIPMGKSTGKVPAILDYARGMGLVQLETENTAIKEPRLTPFGVAVYKHDKYLGDDIIQWLVHMNLCRGDIGAKVWHEVFAKGRSVIGSSFSTEQLENYLCGLFGMGRNRTGPLVSAYLQDAALQRAGVLTVNNKIVIRHKAPIAESFALAYSAHILALLEAYFTDEGQITFTQFNDVTKWFDICLWSDSDLELVFSFIEQIGYISVDRQMRPWLIEPMAKSTEIWHLIWE